MAVDCSDCVYLCRFCHCLLMICWYLRQSDRASSSLLWSWRWHRYTDWYWRTICLQDFVDGWFSECEYRCVSVCVSAWCRPSGPFFNAGCIMYNISIFYFTFYLFVGGAYAPNAPPYVPGAHCGPALTFQVLSKSVQVSGSYDQKTLSQPSQ